MHLKFIEIQNFRKLVSVRIDVADSTTLFVGANNSGKSSAMVALRYFLLEKGSFSFNDITLSNWAAIDKIGEKLESANAGDRDAVVEAAEWNKILPSIDVWLQVAPDEIHHVAHLLPTLDWDGGEIGVRLQLEPKENATLCKDYVKARNAAQETKNAAQTNRQAATNGGTNPRPARAFNVPLWPTSMRTFMEKRLGTHFTVRAYALDPSKLSAPDSGVARPQELPLGREALDRDPFLGLIRIDQINAQRGFSDSGDTREHSVSDEREDSNQGMRLRLSAQLRAYWARHLDPTEMPDSSDIEALQAIYDAEEQFNTRLKEGFSQSLNELESLGYPGVTDPKLTISTKLRATDGINHASAVQYQVPSSGAKTESMSYHLPEQSNGLGYQNLISMAFKLMGFRDAWMQVGKAAKVQRDTHLVPPLHLVLVEEPEAHLHVQVQQVFIRQAHKILRNHSDLASPSKLRTQLIVSTHSSHIAHESDFSCLRYFRRRPALDSGGVPTSTVVNLSEVFGKGNETGRFVTRYLKATHCDLFFADAAIFIEGAAERMLVPHFIREHFSRLNECYISMLELGGSHAHRFRSFIETLGLTTLIITDLDSVDKISQKACPPREAKTGVTSNTVLNEWLPGREGIADLFALSESEREKKYSGFFSIYAAYQVPVDVKLKDESAALPAYPRTFEDALIYDNLQYFRSLQGIGFIKKIRDAIRQAPSVEELERSLFELLRSAGKAEFALDILYQATNIAVLNVPTYIHHGLRWLEGKLVQQQQDVGLVSSDNSTSTQEVKL